MNIIPIYKVKMGKFSDAIKDEADFLLRNKKNVINILILGILILGIYLGINLTRRQQIIKSQAQQESIEFTGNNVTQKDGKWIAASPKVTLKLSSKLGSAGTSNPSPSASSVTQSCTTSITLSISPSSVSVGSNISLTASGVPSGHFDDVFTNTGTNQSGVGSNATAGFTANDCPGATGVSATCTTKAAGTYTWKRTWNESGKSCSSNTVSYTIQSGVI